MFKLNLIAAAQSYDRQPIKRGLNTLSNDAYLTCLEAVWSCNFCIKNLKIISAQKRYLAKSYEYLQMLDRS